MWTSKYNTKSSIDSRQTAKQVIFYDKLMMATFTPGIKPNLIYGQQNDLSINYHQWVLKKHNLYVSWDLIWQWWYIDGLVKED